MDEDQAEVRQVIVDVPVRDKSGQMISDDMLSSGGARSGNGSLVVQYRNPRPARTVVRPVAHGTGEAASTDLKQVLSRYVYPLVLAWWERRGPEDVERAVRWGWARLHRPKEAAGHAQLDSASEIYSPRGDAGRDITSSAGSAAIIVLDDYRVRRSA